MRKKSKLVYGVGINDADYNVTEHALVDGKDKIVRMCPFYRGMVAHVRTVLF